MQGKYIVETYAFYNNTDESILLLNPVLSKYGYKFISIGLQNLEQNFAKLFISSSNYTVTSDSTFDGIPLSSEFIDTLIKFHPFGTDILLSKNVTFLKRITTHEEVIVDNTINPSTSIDVMGQIQKFSESLTHQLHLFKGGDIYHSMLFQITQDTRNVVTKTMGWPRQFSQKIYQIVPGDVIAFSSFFNEQFKPNLLTELAFDNFIHSYEIPNAKTKFLTLMICLECLFNFGKDQIAHTVSRHLALILSKDRLEFDQNYKAIKKLYNIRNTIVHGGTPSGDFESLVTDLQQKVRAALLYCLKQSLTKEQLFEHFNSMGI